MSTLADFDASTNQKIIAALANVPNCMVVDGSRMFAGNPGLPYAASYGSRQFDASLFEQAVQYAATTAATQASLHSTLPSIYGSSPSGNNNSRTNHETSHSEEGFMSDDDEDSSILSNLPNSCHDFELKELHIRLERNHSSPLIGGHCSPAVSSLLSSKCPSTEPPADPAEPEDLEVQLINECFEEQQRQNQMYQSGDLKTLFYHGSSEIDPSKIASRPGADSLVQSPTELPVRLPYAKKLTSQDSFLSSTAHIDCRPTTDTSSKSSKDFEQLVTLQSEALGEKKARKESKISSNRRRVSEPLTHPLVWDDLTTRSDCSSFEELAEPLNNSGSLVAEACSYSSFGQYLRGAVPAIVAKDPNFVKSEADILSKSVIERLFSGVVLASSGSEAKDRSPCFAKSEQSRATRSLYMEHLSSPLYSPHHHSSLPVIKDAVTKSTAAETLLSSDASAQSTSISGILSSTVSRCEHAHAGDDEEKDSWEDLDDKKLEQQVNALKLEVAAKPAKPLINHFVPPLMRPSWDSTFLSHVLEAYDVPEYKVAEDVANALAATDWGNAAVKWLERKMVFIVFPSERQARDALVLHKHQWLRLRPLSKSPAHVQEKAKEMQAQLRPARARPKTNAVVARRMVEHTLGLRSPISKEQREAERKQLSSARAAKKNSARWDD